LTIRGRPNRNGIDPGDHGVFGVKIKIVEFTIDVHPPAVRRVNGIVEPLQPQGDIGAPHGVQVSAAVARGFGGARSTRGLIDPKRASATLERGDLNTPAAGPGHRFTNTVAEFNRQLRQTLAVRFGQFVLHAAPGSDDFFDFF
jgi:hypothetical protein